MKFIKKITTWLAIIALAIPLNLVNIKPVLAAAPADPLNIYVSTTGNDSTGNGTVSTPYATIATAITNANSGGVITVAPGTYNESPNINKPLTLTGAGQTQTIIAPNANSDGVSISANSVTVQDVKIQTSNALATPNIAVKITATDQVTITNNTITTTGDKAMGIWVGGSASSVSPSTNLTITKSTITIANSATGIYADESTTAHNGWIIGGSALNANTITASVGNPIELYDVTNSQVSYNTLNATDQSSLIWSSERTNISSVTVNNNTFNGSGGSELAILNDFPTNTAPATTVATVNLNNNTFTTWGSRAVRIGSGVSGVTLTGNQFLKSPAGEAAKNENTSTTVTATQNWWGSTSGPNHSTNATGTGNSVSDFVTFRPWCNSLACTSNDSTAPTATLTYSKDNGTTYTASSAVKDADTLKIKATFNENIEDATGAMVAIDNSILPATAMAKTSGTVYTYDLNVPTGNIASATVSLSNVYDTSGNILSATPTNNTFTVDNTNPGLATSIIEDMNSDATDEDVANSKQVRTSWSASSESGSGISHYLLRVRQNSSSGTIVSGLDDINIGNVTAYTLTSGQGDLITSDGLYVFGLRAVDNAGNMSSSYSYSDGITIDTTVPTFTIQYYSDTALTNALADNSRLKAGIYYLKVSASETLQGAPTITIGAEGTNNDVASVATTPVSGNDYKLTRTIVSDASAVGSTKEDISITGIDTAGNTATNANPTNEATKAAYTDTTAPGVTVNAKTTSDSTPLLSGTVTGVDNITSTIAVNVNGANYTATNNGNGTWTLADNTITPALGENTYDVTAIATDMASNSATDPTSSELIVDLSAPSVDAGANKTVKAQFTQDATVNGIIAGVASYSWSKQVGPGTVTFSSPSSEDTTISAPTDGSADGTYTIRLTVVDNADNSTYGEMVLIWDTTKPASTVTTSGTVGPNTWGGSVAGTASDGLSGIASVNIKVTNSAGDVYNGTTFITGGEGVTATGTTNWSVPLTTSQLTANGDGVYIITSTATDIAGNIETTGTGIFTWDSTNPTLTVSSPVDGELIASATPTATYSATDTNLAGVTVSIDNGTATAYTSGSSLGTLTNGAHTLKFTATDLAGNIATVEKGITVNASLSKTDNNTQLPANTSNAVIDDTANSGVVLDGIDTTGAVTISIGEYTDQPDTGKLPNIAAFGKHFEITASDTSKITFPMMIKIYYTQTDLNNASITEDKLDGIYFYNSTAGKYERYSDSGVNTTDVTINGTIFAGYVYANADHLTPMTAAYDIVNPDKPANLTATAGDGKVILTWDKVSDANSYQIRYRKSTSADTTAYTEISVDSSTSSKEITGLENGVEYEFGMAAKDRVGNLSQYAVVVATPKAAVSTAATTEKAKVVYAAAPASKIIASESFEDKSELKQEEPKAEEKTIDEGEIKGEETETAGSRAAVTFAILLLALAAGVGGYYGYEWWVERKLSDGPRYIPTEKPAKISPKKRTKKSNRRNGRW